MGFSHHAWWLFAGFWDPTTCIEKNVKKGHESSDLVFFLPPEREGVLFVEFQLSERRPNRGPQVSDHWRFAAAKKKKVTT